MRALIAILLIAAACGPDRRGDNGNGDDGGGSSCSRDLCSADLHDVVDCNGNVIQQCDADLGCANGACVDPCDAAAANTSSVGCDYYAVNPDSSLTANGGVLRGVSSRTRGPRRSRSTSSTTARRCRSTASRAIPTGQGGAITYTPLHGRHAAADQVAILFLAQPSGDPAAWHERARPGITPAFTTADAAVHGTGLGQRVPHHDLRARRRVRHLPVRRRQAAATSATLLMPTTRVGHELRRRRRVRGTAHRLDRRQAQQRSIELVAQQDGTHSHDQPDRRDRRRHRRRRGARQARPRRTRSTAGQVLQFTQDAELTGSPITVDKPIGVWGGDDLHEHPVDERRVRLRAPADPAGSRARAPSTSACAIATASTDTDETPPWRDRRRGRRHDAHLRARARRRARRRRSRVGQVAEFNAPGPFIVKSQDDDHPFYMSAHMTGCETVNPDAQRLPRRPGVRQRRAARAVPRGVHVLHRSDLPRDQPRPRRARATDGVRRRDARLRRAPSPAGRRSMPATTIEYTRVDLVTGNFQGVGQLQQRPAHRGRARSRSVSSCGAGASAATGLFSSTYVSYAYPAGAERQADQPRRDPVAGRSRATSRKETSVLEALISRG